ncbi:hypothetical protein niasHS_016184 [Heterodera schachtii]|uniref:Nucleotide-diphospho-sugar transferase domain-containing protein n=1 Tax=Heterodera schachtii TaxID=97005 RepID=A0ABD2HVM5_HETSC
MSFSIASAISLFFVLFFKSIFCQLSSDQAINRIKVQGKMLLLDKPIVKQMEQMGNQFRCEKNSNCGASGIDECNGEKMAYTLKLNNSRIIRGRKFNCSLTRLLDHYKLSDKYAIKKNTEKIIAYDLGTVSKNKEWMKELNSVCNFELRVYNFSQMVNERIRDLKSYAFKFFIWADVLLEYDTVVWLDTSAIFFQNDFKRFFEPMQKGKIGTVQSPSFALHSTNMATHPGMYEFLPLYINFEPTRRWELVGTYPPVSEFDPPMFEAGLVMLHKSEQTRQVMKW